MLPVDTPIRIKALLLQRGITDYDDAVDFEVWDDGKGNITLSVWNEAKLGPQPTDADINATLPYVETEDDKLDADFPPTESRWKTLLQILFTMENQIRVLQGKATLTHDEFRALLKGIMNG